MKTLTNGYSYEEWYNNEESIRAFDIYNKEGVFIGEWYGSEDELIAYLGLY